MSLTHELVKKVYEKNQKSRDNTYIVPKHAFEGFFPDELMFVREAKENLCLVFRSMDGKLYNLSEDQLKKFKCVGNCHGC